MTLSVLDTSPIVAGSSAPEALRHSLDLARTADRLGYHRYWLAELHGMRGVASSATAVLVGEIANATARTATAAPRGSAPGSASRPAGGGPMSRCPPG